jgi:hypothetical protein
MPIADPIELDTAPASRYATVRKPGDFARRGDNGPPYVAHPTDTVKPTGRKDELIAKCVARGIDVPDKITVAGLVELLGGDPKMVLYSRPSSLGSLIGDRTQLVRWGERGLVRGIAMEPQLLARLQGCTLDEEDEILDGIIAAGKEAADLDLAADRGTYVHLICNAADRGEPLPEPSERFGFTAQMVQAIADGWRHLITDNGLEILAIELAVVGDDDPRAAGNLDVIARTTTPLVFGDVAIPADVVIVIDIKTSGLHPDANGVPKYWDDYPIQLARYASSVPYDTDTDTRYPWAAVVDADGANRTVGES